MYECLQTKQGCKPRGVKKNDIKKFKIITNKKIT